MLFFLVTTTISADKGISRKLPAICPPGIDRSLEINERNILRIALNTKNEIMVNHEIIELNELKDIAKAFLDNNGTGDCSYCHGKAMTMFSDRPKDTVVSLSSSDHSNYATFIAIQDELSKAYYELLSINFQIRDS